MFYIGLEENMKNLPVDLYLVSSIIICILFVSSLGFDDWIWVLIASLPGGILCSNVL